MGITASSLNLTDFDIERECCCCCCRSFSIFHSENFLFSSVRRRESLFFIQFYSRSTLSRRRLVSFKKQRHATRTNDSHSFFCCLLSLMNKQRYLRTVTTSSRPLRFRRYTKGSNNSIKNTKDTSAKTNC